MPIFQEPDYILPKRVQASELPSRDIIMRRPSEESIRTEFCDGPLPDTPLENTLETRDHRRREDSPGNNGYGVCTSDRIELMERIKRGESPTWVPSQTVCQSRLLSLGSTLLSLSLSIYDVHPHQLLLALRLGPVILDPPPSVFNHTICQISKDQYRRRTLLTSPCHIASGMLAR